jgi:hypothetical protein
VSGTPWFESFFGRDYFELHEQILVDARTVAEVDGVVALLELAPGSRCVRVLRGPGR